MSERPTMKLEDWDFKPPDISPASGEGTRTGDRAIWAMMQSIILHSETPVKTMDIEVQVYLPG